MDVKEGTETYVGRLCPQGHEYQDSGMSLRYRSCRACIACRAGRKRSTWRGRRGATILGRLCTRGHEHEGTGKSLRYASNHSCVGCVHERNLTDYGRAQKDAAARRWRREHPEQVRAISRTYHRSARARLTRLAWYAATIEARRAYMSIQNRRRKARLQAVVQEPYTVGDVAALFAVYEGWCAYCGARATELDHVVPLSSGGHDALYNLAPCCRTCNASKGKRTVDEWYKEQPFYSLARLELMAAQQCAAGLPQMSGA